MAAVSLFWDSNMAAATSCENTLYESVDSSPKKVISLFKVKVFIICTMPVQIAKSPKI